MPQKEGTVTIAQEERFQLTDPHGVSHLFILSYRSPVEPDQLKALQQRQSYVRVTYKPADNLLGLVADSIELLPDTASELASELADVEKVRH